DRIMDFSHAGYMGGGVTIPVVPVRRKLKPSGGDETAKIQRAISEVAAMKFEERGAVLLAPGVFTCSNTLTIVGSGVVLRGSGSGVGGTTIKLAGKPHNGITIRGAGEMQATESKLAQSAIADACVPSGAAKFSIADASGFAVS